jgi:ligand-binding sensor domain-containing protein
MLLILIIHFPLYSFAQNYHSKLINLNGHIKSPVTSMCQSNDGFIWLGTDLGIIRYDGTNYTVLARILRVKKRSRSHLASASGISFT